MAAAFADGQHGGVGRAAEEQLPHGVAPPRPQPPALAGAVEPLQAARLRRRVRAHPAAGQGHRNRPLPGSPPAPRTPAAGGRVLARCGAPKSSCRLPLPAQRLGERLLRAAADWPAAAHPGRRLQPAGPRSRARQVCSESRPAHGPVSPPAVGWHREGGCPRVPPLADTGRAPPRPGLEHRVPRGRDSPHSADSPMSGVAARPPVEGHFIHAQCCSSGHWGSRCHGLLGDWGRAQLMREKWPAALRQVVVLLYSAW